MKPFQNPFSRFLAFRNRPDELNRFLIWFTVPMLILNLFLRHRFLYQITIFSTVFILYRLFSKNQYARLRENRIFLNMKKRFLLFLRRQLARVKDFPTHRYRTCPRCKSYLKLPKRKGTHVAICPRCSHEFQVKIWI